MSAFKRWWKFNVIGALGTAIQLSALALLTGVWRGHYLLASATAVELAVLHNFFWHIHYTWRDRRGHIFWPRQLLRFHLSNGIASMTGNLLLMRLFVHRLHCPVIPANAITVACCSVVNFALSDRWTFQQSRGSQTETMLSPLAGNTQLHRAWCPNYFVHTCGCCPATCMA